MIFHSSGSSGSCYVVHAELKLFLPQPPKCGDYRSMPLLSSGPCWGPLDFSGCYEMYGMRDAAELVEGQASSSTAENGVAVLVSSIILSHCEQNAWQRKGRKVLFDSWFPVPVHHGRGGITEFMVAGACVRDSSQHSGQGSLEQLDPGGSCYNH